MKKGIINVLTFYTIGIATTLLTYLIFGQEHGQGLYIIVFFLTILIGIFWTGSTIFNHYFKNKTDKRKGIIISNIIVFIILTLTISYIEYDSTKDTEDNSQHDELSASQNGDSTIIKYKGTLIYLKIKDSIYVDKKDSLFRTRKK